jgi:hypothetical protein
MGWAQMTFDLVGAQDVRDAIRWADAKLASDEGPVSGDGRPVDDREYVVYVKVPDEDRWLQVAGRNPVLVPRGEPDDPHRPAIEEGNG